MEMSRSVVVTGIGSGIGAAVARRLVDDGWYVSGVEIDEGSADLATRNLGPDAVVTVGDAADPATLTRAADLARDAAPLRGWVSNAAICPRGTSVHDVDLDAVRRVWELNSLAVLAGSQIAIRAALEHGLGSSLVAVSSIHGSRSFGTHPEYDMSKAAVEALTRNIAVAYGSRGIRSNAVAPGGIETAMYADGVARPGTLDVAVRSTPLNRLGTPAEVARLVGFLLGDDSSYVTGQVIGVDGGWSASLAPREAR